MSTQFGVGAHGCPSMSLALWADEWLGGSASPDDLIDALVTWAPMHLAVAGNDHAAAVTGLPWPAPGEQGLAEVLRVLRDGGDLDLLLPVPGDVRGLPPKTTFARAALECGEAVLVRPTGAHAAAAVGLVPVVEGPDVLRWVGYAVDHADLENTPPAAHDSLGDAEYLMRTAVREAALVLSDSGAAESAAALGTDPRAEVEDLLDRWHAHPLPAVLPERAERVLESAAHVAAILTVAGADRGPQSASALQLRETTLRPLWDHVRRARLAAVAAARHEQIRRSNPGHTAGR